MKIKMFRLLVSAVLLATAFAVEDFTLQFSVPTPSGTNEVATLAVKACRETNFVSYHVEESDSIPEVNGLEDYNTGFGADRYATQEGEETCLVRKLASSNIADRIAQLKTQTSEVQDISKEAEQSISPIDGSEDLPESIEKFCEGASMFKASSEVTVKKMEVASTRHFRFPIRRCYFFGLVHYCYCTTLTMSTGATSIFNWLFG